MRKPNREQALEAIRVLLSYIGENPDRPGLVETPDRVIRAWEQDWGIGYNQEFIKLQTESIKKGRFEDGAEDVDEMVCVKDISFTSHCEHHMAQFTGTVDIAYIPVKAILGLSKLVRVVELFSKRLQVQERLTNQIANFINESCHPVGVGVVIRATHSCMCSRGVKQHATLAVTSALRGQILERAEVRDEFLRLVGR